MLADKKKLIMFIYHRCKCVNVLTKTPKQGERDNINPKFYEM